MDGMADPCLLPRGFASLGKANQKLAITGSNDGALLGCCGLVRINEKDLVCSLGCLTGE